MYVANIKQQWKLYFMAATPQNTLGPAYNEFSYNEHLGMTRFYRL